MDMRFNKKQLSWRHIMPIRKGEAEEIYVCPRTIVYCLEQ
jgi:hypothetical protein